MTTIYFLEHNTEDCARAHVDAHLAPLISRTARMLSTALRRHGMFDDILYPSVDEDEPMVRWVGENRSNFLWALSLLVELISEADHRFGAMKNPRTAKYARARQVAQSAVALNTCVPTGEMTPPPQLMPPDFQGRDTIQAYRYYYRHAKQHLAKWTRRDTPTWWTEA